MKSLSTATLTLFFIFFLTQKSTFAVGDTNSYIDSVPNKSIETFCFKDSNFIETKSKNNNVSYNTESANSGTNWINYILPIITLFLGVGLNKGLDYWSDKKRLKKALKRWAAEIRSLEEPMHNQIDALEKFIGENNEDVFEFPNPVVYAILDCSIFSSLDKGELMEAIQRTKGVNYDIAVPISNSINGFISIQVSTYDVLKDKFHEFKNEFSKHVNSFSSNLQALLRANAEYGVELERATGKDPATIPEYKAILDLFSVHVFPQMKDGNYNPFQMDADFFQPMISILSHLRLDERTKYLMTCVSNCIVDIGKLRMERVYMTSNMNTIIDKYKNQIDDLKDVVGKIELK